RAAYDFLLLREESGENLNQLGQWWTEYQAGDVQARREMVHALNQKGRSKHKRKRKRKKAGEN
ncbi:MAG: polynucleotide adenylyltransferase PcnB, partial [Pseudomonadales bacterium]|nr:polynucleotide adenylyltransferase PcnB [Pseudomonadales bacterium]